MWLIISGTIILFILFCWLCCIMNNIQYMNNGSRTWWWKCCPIPIELRPFTDYTQNENNNSDIV